MVETELKINKKHLKKPTPWAGIFGGSILGFLVFIGLTAPIFFPNGTRIQGPPLQPPSAEHWFGTDNLGRDILAFLAHGASTSLMVGVSVAVCCLIIGSIVGSLAGYYGGWIDTLLTRITEFFQVLPAFVIALLVIALFGQGVTFTIIALSAAMWPRVARIIRAQFMSYREREFVESLRSQGFKDRRIIWFEILPNVIAPALIQATLDMGIAILYEAGLSFLGLGDPNLPTWGQLLNAAQHNLPTAPWISIMPGFAIFLAVLGINLLGDSLNQKVNPGKLEV